MAASANHPELKGTRVCLRRPTRRDARSLLRLKRSSRAHLTPWEATPHGGADPFSMRWFDGFLRTSHTVQSRRFLVCRSDDGEIVGQLGLGGIVRGAVQSCYLGYWIGSTFEGQGLMSEAVRLALAHAFGPLGLHRVEANVIPRNRRSASLVRRLGFRPEGLARRYLRIAGRWQDHVHWAITAEEWRRGVRSKPG